MREHNEPSARRMIAQTPDVLNLYTKSLGTRKKSDPRRRAIAWWVRTHSAVSNQWVAQALHMGHPVASQNSADNGGAELYTAEAAHAIKKPTGPNPSPSVFRTKNRAIRYESFQPR